MKQFNVWVINLGKWLSVFILLFLAGCTWNLPNATPTMTVDIIPTDPNTPQAIETPLPYLLIDANPVMSGICFESVYDAAGRTFIFRSTDELNALFTESDNSDYCRRPSVRGSFDFSGGRAMIGIWNIGRGCEASHHISGVEIDDVARTFIIRAELVVEGNCPYELVRPLWLGVTGYADYDIRLLVQG